MLVEDSSSASAKLLYITNIKQTSFGVYEITPDSGSAFFLRADYLCSVSPDLLLPVKGGLGQGDSLFFDIKDFAEGMQGVFNEEQTADIYNASLIYAAEVAAMSYLSRAEHCRFSLTQKLLKKDYSRNHIETALDYLESINYLSDERFAGAWLRTRYIDHAEGRRRLSAELASRNVDRSAARKALDEFFEDHDEKQICVRAYRKILRMNRNLTEDKIRVSLARLGFSSSLIKFAMSSED